MVSLITLRRVLTKTLPAICIQLHNYVFFEKARLKLSPLKQNSVLQDYLLESYARYLTSYQNVKKLLHPPDVDCPPFPWIFTGNPVDGAKFYPTAKKLLIFPIRKISLKRFKSFSIKSFISSPSNSNFQAITLCNFHL